MVTATDPTRAETQPDCDEPDWDEPDGDREDGSTAPTDPQGQLAPTANGRAGMELRVRLSTLLGLDQYPAELAGWAPFMPNWPVTSPPPSAAPSGAS